MSSPVGTLGGVRVGAGRGLTAGAELVGQRLQRPGGVVGPAGEQVDRAALGEQLAGLVRVGEERHRLLGVHEDEVGQAVTAAGWRPRTGSRAGRAGRRPAPRAMRVGKISARTWASACSAITAAVSMAPAPHSTSPPSSSSVGSPRAQDRRRCRRWVVVDLGVPRRCDPVGGIAAVAPATSAGRISVAIWPGAPIAAATASAASEPTSDGACERADPLADVAGHRHDVGLQRGVELLVGQRVVADDVTMGLPARRPLCRLASPLPSPGPGAAARPRACAPCGRTRRRRRWRRPRTGRGRPASRARRPARRRSASRRCPGW